MVNRDRLRMEHRITKLETEIEEMKRWVKKTSREGWARFIFVMSGLITVLAVVIK